MITIARIDERLIHGQVAFAWTTAYESQVVMVIDEEVSKDDFQKSLLEMACPTGLKCLVVDQDNAIKFLEKNQKTKFFIVVKHPKILLYLVEKGIPLEKINVGGLYYQEGRRQIDKTVYVDEEMVDAFKQLHAKGVSLDVRTTPTDTSEDLMKLL